MFFKHGFSPLIDGGPYTPTPYQKAFHECEDKFRVISGSVGVGKTTCCLIEALYESYIYPNNFGLILTPYLEHSRNMIDALLPENMKVGEDHPQYNAGVLQVKSREPDKLSQITLLPTIDKAYEIDAMQLGWFMVEYPEFLTPLFNDSIIKRLKRRNSSRKGWYERRTGNVSIPWLKELIDGSNEH